MGVGNEVAVLIRGDRMVSEIGFAPAGEEDGLDHEIAQAGVGMDERARHAAAGGEELSSEMEGKTGRLTTEHTEGTEGEKRFEI